MADKKRVYSIVINGLQESLDMVESLNKQLKELDNTIKAVEKRTIKIKGEVEVDTEKTKTVVSGKSSSGGTTDVDKEKELAIQKQITAEIKAQGQYQAALDESYRQGMQTVKQTKEDTKNLLSGAIDEAGQFTNTMAGWKAELKALKQEREGLDITNPEDVKRFAEIQERANALTTILKTIEYETGQFGRNVGNYPQMFGNLNNELKSVEQTIRTIENEMSSASGDRYAKLATELEIAKKRAEDLKKQIEEVGQQIQSMPKFTVNVGDTVREFDNAKQASKELLQEYTKLVAEGKQDTQEARNLAEAYGRVATATKNARGELQSYVGNAKALKDTVEIMQGVASIGSLGAGLSGLFGGKNEELDKSLKTFTNLSLIMNGLANLQKSINDKTSVWGATLAWVWEQADKGLTWFGKITGLSKLLGERLGGDLAPLIRIGDELNETVAEFDELVERTKQENTELGELGAKLAEATKEASLLKARLDSTSSPEQKVELTDNLKEKQSEIDGYREKLTQLSAAGNKTAESMLDLNAIITSLSNKTLKGFSTVTQKAVDRLLAMGKAGRVVAIGINFASAAFKTFAKATIILAALQVALEGVEWVVEKLGDAWKVLTGHGGLEIDKQMQMAADNTELANEQLEKYINTMNLAKNLGLLSELQAQGLVFKEIDKYIQKAGKDLQDYIKIQKDLKDMPLKMQYNNSSIWGDDSDIKNMEEFEKEWDILVKAVETGQDKIEAGSKRGSKLLLTSGDAVEELGDKTKAVLGDMLFQINLIDFKNPEKAVKQFRKIADDELYQSALTQMHTLFPEEEWAKSLDRMYKNLSDMVDKSEQRAKDLAVAIKQANEELANAAELSNINAISDANKRQEALDEYNKKKRKKEIQDSVADEEYKQKALEALDKEYAQKAKDRAKARAKSLQSAGDTEYAILKQIRDNLLALEKDGLDKQIKQLENARDDELRNANKAGKHRGELILSIQQKYQKQIEDTRVEWYKNQKKQIEQWNNELIKMAQETADELADIQRTGRLNAINRGLEGLENKNINQKATISYDTDVDTSSMTFEENDALLQKQKQYYKDLLQAQSDYNAEKAQLQEAESRENEEQLKEQAKREYNQRVEANRQWQEAQFEELENFKKQGLITEEEFNQKNQQLADTYTQSNLDAWDTYQQKLTEATTNGEQERANIISDFRQEQQRINDEANQQAIDAIQDYYNEIADISDREQRKNTNRHTGLFNYAKEKERLEQVKAGYEETIVELEAQYDDLVEQYNSGEIDFGQFTNAKKQIEDLEKQAKDGAENTSEGLNDLFQNWAESVNSFASKIASQFQDMFSTFQNIQSLMLDAEAAQLDEEQKMLDKETEMVEKAYDKQADIVQRYKDAINGTEDELKNARGERRLALLDSLVQQKEGYAAETEALKKQELEKEKIAQKEEQLKKKQDALEKKRKQLQQKASIVNATINTALGVTQALAAWPPPASYALASAVGALGAVEIALIASQKYKKGGLLSGPSHEQGGIKVPVRGGLAEVEGSEYIVNKKTTTENLSLIEFVNSRKRRLQLDDFIEFYSGKAKGHKPGSSLKFAQGGTLPELTDYSDYQVNQPVVVDLTLDSKVSVVDISNALDRLTQVKVLAGV